MTRPSETSVSMQNVLGEFSSSASSALLKAKVQSNYTDFAMALKQYSLSEVMRSIGNDTWADEILKNNEETFNYIYANAITRCAYDARVSVQEVALAIDEYIELLFVRFTDIDVKLIPSIKRANTIAFFMLFTATHNDLLEEIQNEK